MLVVDNRYTLLSTAADDAFSATASISGMAAEVHSSARQSLSCPSSSICNAEQNVKESKQPVGLLALLLFSCYLSGLDAHQLSFDIGRPLCLGRM